MTKNNGSVLILATRHGGVLAKHVLALIHSFGGDIPQRKMIVQALLAKGADVNA
jgi:hypothetical protein